ncbi:MAG TPA: CD225/dispanin family protein [Pseudoxanthomonas sp.]|uniref:CD225/dispanin family protein n=1 Tax=Pseudoxanthomonas sp. SE1 TaxID=1664560 RepID=UPI00240E3D5D|nr:CD225/dispanin family protein [Pseudoxanthomonas sp. SE1]WFC41534.1 CD225/dispanin family protein [Pseudoxanthomonas sp. SE1]HJS36325.1 CD225/dispanin family protein [Pseudoxanthomonas sp.]
MNTNSQYVPNHLVWAILSTLFCCLPLGIVSIVFAAQVNGKLAVGDMAGAQEASDKAKKWAMWSAIAGVSLVVLYIIFIFAMGGMAAMSQ